ncbi:MAG: hypothetical protein II819_03730, partial [Fibrobacter sp.]|nr:hypothetical protein [Fibrobacter sp.]
KIACMYFPFRIKELARCVHYLGTVFAPGAGPQQARNQPEINPKTDFRVFPHLGTVFASEPTRVYPHLA